MFEMYFFEGGICIITSAVLAVRSPPPPLLIRSRAHPFTTYLDVKLLDIKTHYLDVMMRGVFVYRGECDLFHLLPFYLPPFNQLSITITIYPSLGLYSPSVPCLTSFRRKRRLF